MSSIADLSGRVALVTGASRGIGRSLVSALADVGATVLAGVRDELGKEAWAREVDSGASIQPIAFDVREVGETRRAVDAAVAEHGRIDILVNNAGLGREHDPLEVTEADWDELHDVNLKGAFFVTQAVGRHMVAARYGRIVMISSQASLVGLPRSAVYCATKAGLNGLARTLALEWAPFGVTVNCVAPTWIYTPGTAGRLDLPDFRQSVLDRIPVGRIGQPADVAAAVTFLASEASGLITGAVLPVDGGWTVQ
jgi:NAD(P)-dependent dehydrogenase (short-subunit alcohol dehydrogenase family)